MNGFKVYITKAEARGNRFSSVKWVPGIFWAKLLNPPHLKIFETGGKPPEDFPSFDHDDLQFGEKLALLLTSENVKR